MLAETSSMSYTIHTVELCIVIILSAPLRLVNIGFLKRCMENIESSGKDMQIIGIVHIIFLFRFSL